MSQTRKYIPLAVLLLATAGCGAGGSMGAEAGGASKQDYGATKQMVVDILHSPEGKTAVEQMLQDPTMKQKIVVSETDIGKAVQQTLESNSSKSFLSQQLKDPTFAAALAKAVQPELNDLQKQLMKDPAYQKDMLILLKSPEFTKNVQDLLQTPQFRGAIMKIMTEALQTPSFRMQFQDSLKKAVAESMQASGGKSKGSGESSGGGGGESGGGGGDSSGGGGDSSGGGQSQQ
jgi:spore germination protein D